MHTDKRCKNCSNEDCVWAGHAEHISEKCLGYEPQTNYDRIHRMTVEELAGKIADAYGIGGVCPENHTHLYCVLDNGCVRCWLSWLKAPVEVQDGNG